LINIPSPPPGSDAVKKVLNPLLKWVNSLALPSLRHNCWDDFVETHNDCSCGWGKKKRNLKKCYWK